MKKVYVALLTLTLLYLPEGLFASTSTTTNEQEWQRNVDQIVASCTQLKKRDAICDSVIVMKQIGNDSVEFIKEYMNLTPLGYATLTLANFAATGRLRVKTDSFLFKKAHHVYDYQMYKEEIWFYIEKNY